MAHTPGPWKVETETESDDLGISVNFVTQIVGTNSEVVCIFEGHGDKLEFDNANLISAAPELLEALEDVMKLIDFPISDPTERMMKAHRVVAKARGKP